MMTMSLCHLRGIATSSLLRLRPEGDIEPVLWQVFHSHNNGGILQRRVQIKPAKLVRMARCDGAIMIPSSKLNVQQSGEDRSS